MRLTLGYLLLLGGSLLLLGTIIYVTLPADLIELLIDRAGGYLLAAVFLVVVISGILVLVLARGLTRPLSEITETARQLIKGNWNAVVKYPPSDEIGEVACALNCLSRQVRESVDALEESKGRLEALLEHMSSGVMLVDCEGKMVLVNLAAEVILGICEADALGRSQVEVTQNYPLSQLISEVLQNWQPQRREISLFYPRERILDVTAAPVFGEGREMSGVVVVLYDLTATRQLERMRADFMANVSHELKTPVTSIKGFAETLLEGALYNHRAAEEFLHIIDQEADRLARLINDLLELSKIEFRELKPRLVSLELTAEIKEIVDLIRPRFRKKGLELHAELPDEPAFVQADPDLFQQVLVNLLDNSLKYTPNGGQVRVRLLSGPDEVVAVVEDTGVGIPAADLPRIFERFYRVDKARSRKLGGTGLGLAIVKHVVKAHGGRVWAESKQGRGSSFYFSLPVDKTGGVGEDGREQV